MSGTGNTTRVDTSSERNTPLDAVDDGRGMGTMDERPVKRVRRQNVVTNASSFGDIGYYAAVSDPEPLNNPTVRKALNSQHVYD
jgi:hypothetical protein